MTATDGWAANDPRSDVMVRNEFRAGFYPHRLAAWVDSYVSEEDTVSADVAGCLAAIENGKVDFAYPGHDAAAFRLLSRLVPERNLVNGADIGCATGAFPAMQIAAGIASCTVFEVRETETNHERVEVRVQDLTYAENVQPEFDLITCLSTIEHIGLARYGDLLDPWGDVKMAGNLRRLLRPRGILVLSFPTGRGCVAFNKHRVYTPFRSKALFGELTVLGHVHRPSLAWRTRHRLRSPLGDGAEQPIFVLERPVEGSV
jgi:SAM-dependent methyltransferase